MRSSALTVAVVQLFCAPAWTADWITAPSYYTHDWTNGERVAQYAPVGPFYYYQRPDYQRSGYRHYRSTLDLGNSSDNMHIVEEWGAPVVPYEHWRFPYRPYGVPYGAWGPPFGGLGGGTGGYPYSGPGGRVNLYGGFFPPYGAGFGAAGAIGPGGPGPGIPGGIWPGWSPPPVNFAQPWLDGHYPSYDLNDRSRYWQPYLPPVPPRF
jgi:hypothetical protein